MRGEEGGPPRSGKSEATSEVVEDKVSTEGIVDDKDVEGFAGGREDGEGFGSRRTRTPAARVRAQPQPLAIRPANNDERRCPSVAIKI